MGVRWIDPATGDEYESTSHGCLCEGWGLVIDDGLPGGAFGGANIASGISGLTAVSFASTASTATSVVRLTGTDVYVTHHYSPSPKTDDLYQVDVTIENRGATDVATMEYRRVMDWDTSPTPFAEYVEIGGTATTTLLETSSDDGFDGSDPRNIPSDLAGCGVKVDFTACGPADHGAVFDFLLGGLKAGDSYSFKTFYGGSEDRTGALAALGAVGAELYSFGWSTLDPDQDGVGTGGETTPTFIFAFSGVGGTVVVPPPTPAIPLPAGGWLLLSGLGALAALRRGKRRNTAA